MIAVRRIATRIIIDRAPALIDPSGRGRIALCNSARAHPRRRDIVIVAVVGRLATSEA